ncbi:hypothetical protein AAT19DRAFT_15164 [Rhodotorula toruloides]|uniref:Uncharacterized protein n=1 Tax=Rhodotorula toruloides TaxID=5286 RepID=A0A2T0A6G0_RHOTO|nr:hypothetical protein AAT19DRAFT_15164 [Rhodotorula toruloides]
MALNWHTHTHCLALRCVVEVAVQFARDQISRERGWKERATGRIGAIVVRVLLRYCRRVLVCACEPALRPCERVAVSKEAGGSLERAHTAGTPLARLLGQGSATGLLLATHRPRPSTQPAAQPRRQPIPALPSSTPRTRTRLALLDGHRCTQDQRRKTTRGTQEQGGRSPALQ